jgi:hypothetical protein
MIFTLLMGWLSALWARFALQISIIGAALIGLAMVFAKGKAAGKYEYERRSRALNNKAAERTNKIVNKVRLAGDEEVERRLDRYYRD